MRKIYIFPFAAEHLPMLRYQERLCSLYKIVPIVFPEINLDEGISILDNGDYLEFESYDINEANSNDLFYFTSGDGSVTNMLEAIKLSKKILSMGLEIEVHLNHKESEKLKLLDPEFYYSKGLKYFNDLYPQFQPIQLEKKRKLNTFDIPIIGVSSITSKNNKTEVCLATSQFFELQGRKCLCVLNESMYQNYDVAILNPDILRNMDVDSMLFYVNSYIYSLCQKQKYDIIVLEIPGGIMSYDSFYLDSAGYYSYLFSRCLDIVYMICCVSLTYSNEAYYNEIRNYINKKYDISEISFHMSNYLIDTKVFSVSETIAGCYLNKTEYISIKDMINSKIGNVENKLFDLRRKEDLEFIFGQE